MFYVLPTIDVEAAHGDRPFDRMILGLAQDGEEYGVYKLAKLFSEFSYEATFFVDVFESSLWGEVVFSQLCENLKKNKQDVQLHTHPGWRHDNRDTIWLNDLKKNKSLMPPYKDLMTKLSFDEQVTILDHGASLIYKWIGERPIAHRSGGYSVNLDTLKALKELNIPIDSSCNAVHKNTHFYQNYNAPSMVNGILELPITLGEIKLPFLSRKIKTDIEIMDANQLISWTEIAIENGLPFMNLFMHSYSLIDRSENFTRFGFNKERYEKLREFLIWCSDNKKIQVISMSQFHKIKLDNVVINSTDYIPQIKTHPLQIINHLSHKTKKIIHSINNNISFNRS